MTGVQTCALPISIVEVKRHRASNDIAPRLLHQSLRILKERMDGHSVCDYPTEAFPRGAIFWPVKAFEDLGPIGLGNMELPATRCNLHPWEMRDNAGRLRMPAERPREPDLFDESDWRIEGI